MAKKNKSKASHTLVDLDQPLVKNEAQEVITCTESEPGMPDAQEASVCAELERCSTADEQREPVYAEWELEPATEAQAPLANTEQESAADEQNELVPEQKINDEEDAPHHPEQELVNQASPDSPADQQDDQQEPDKLLESVTPQIKKKNKLARSQWSFIIAVIAVSVVFLVRIVSVVHAQMRLQFYLVTLKNKYKYPSLLPYRQVKINNLWSGEDLRSTGLTFSLRIIIFGNV